MGKGAFVTVTNMTNSDLKVKPAGSDCMENMGESQWQNFDIPSQETSESVYIEAKSSGSCAFSASTAGYVFANKSAKGRWNDIGSIDLRESGGRWSLEKSTVNVTFKVDGGGEQDKIHIEVHNP